MSTTSVSGSSGALVELTDAQKAELQKWATIYPYKIMGLVEALRCVQDWFLHIPPEAELYLAELFETTRAHVHGVATFFPYFTQAPTGKHRLGICHGLSCQMAGQPKMSKCLEKKLGVREREVTKDGRFSWEEMECLGACEQAPALLLNEELQGACTEEAVEKLKRDLA